MIVNNITLPIYKVGDEVEYTGGNDIAGDKNFHLEENIHPPYIITKIGIDKFNSRKLRDVPNVTKWVLKLAVCINNIEKYVFVAWMFQKINK